MKYKLLFVLILVIAGFTYINGQTGKIVGKIVDIETGEGLIGANVLVEGTSLGAATNVNGEYIILNVSPGSYSIAARYIGYQTITKSNIKVSTNVTTEVNFELPSDTYELDVVEIVAPKPLINKNLTNSVNIIRSEDIENLPVRGINNVVSTQAGVVNKGGNLYVRGGRLDEVAFYIDGVLVNNPLLGGTTTEGIINAVEEIQVQAGGYPAEFGGANAGIISATTKTGQENYRFGSEVITDNFSKVGEEYLGGYSYGYSEYVLTASGPLLPSLRFFVAGNNVFNRTPIGFNRTIEMRNVFDPALGSTADTFDVVYPGGYRLNNATNTYRLQGNLTLDLNPVTFRINGNYETFEQRNGADVFNINRQNRAGYTEGETISGSFKFTHVFSNNAFYDLIFNYFQDYDVQMDPIFKHNLPSYGDSIANAEVGSTLRSDGQFLPTINAYGITFERAERPFNAYTKSKSNSMGGKVNLLYQLGQNHEFKLGGEFTRYTIRRYVLPSPVGLAANRISNPQGEFTDIYARVDNYGYDVFGNETEEGLLEPKNPIFAAGYIQDKMEFSDLVINFGLRFDYIDIDNKVFTDPSKVIFDENDEIDISSLKDSEPFQQVSPRLGFSFPVTDKTVFHAQYGKFIQQSRLRDVYLGYNVVADNIKGGFAIQNPVGFGIRPERTTQYEIGFKQQIGDNFAFDFTGFYKDIKDQVQIRSIYADPTANHRLYYGWVNGDFSTVKGLEIKLDLRRAERISATLDYTFSDAQGTGSNPSTGFRMIWQSPTATPFFPQQIAPLDFNQTHRGAINIDYRFAEDDGPAVLGNKMLENFGVNILFTFASGFNYTRFNEESFGNSRIPLEPLNTSTTPWTFQLDLRLDKTVTFGSLDANFYVSVINVINTQNVVNVFPVSGDAYDDGFLTSPTGSAKVEGIRRQFGDAKAQEYMDLYRATTYASLSFLAIPDNFGPPRQIRLGLRLNY